VTTIGILQEFLAGICADIKRLRDLRRSAGLVAVVLLVAAGLLGRTLLRVSSLDPGVNIHNVLVTRMALSPGVLADPGRIRPAWQDVLDRAHRVPGVQSVAAVDTVPTREGNNQIGCPVRYASTP
jgi:hypothetical protein